MTQNALQRRARPNGLEERRAALVAAVEAAIDALDAFDGDADLEPCCGSLAVERWEDQRQWSAGACDDREFDPDDGTGEASVRCEIGLW